MAELSAITEKQLEEAKALFMAFTPVVHIAEKLDVNRSTLNNHLRKQKWREERDTFSNELISEIAANKKTQLTKISGLTANVLIKSLEALNKAKKPLTLREARDAAALFETLDKILKLDEGRPTDIIATEKPATIIEIQRRLNNDPLQNIEYTEFEESDNEEDSINVNTIRND